MALQVLKAVPTQHRALSDLFVDAVTQGNETLAKEVLKYIPVGQRLLTKEIAPNPPEAMSVEALHKIGGELIKEKASAPPSPDKIELLNLLAALNNPARTPPVYKEGALAVGYVWLRDRSSWRGDKSIQDQLKLLAQHADPDLRKMVMSVLNTSAAGRLLLADVLGTVAAIPVSTLSDRGERITEILGYLDPQKTYPGLDHGASGIHRVGHEIHRTKTRKAPFRVLESTVQTVVSAYQAKPSDVDFRALLMLCYSHPRWGTNRTLLASLAPVAQDSIFDERLLKVQVANGPKARLEAAELFLKSGRYADAVSFLETERRELADKLTIAQYENSQDVEETLALLAEAYLRVGVIISKENKTSESVTPLQLAERYYEQAIQNHTRRSPASATSFKRGRYQIGLAEVYTEQGFADKAEKTVRAAVAEIEVVAGVRPSDKAKALIYANHVLGLAIAHRAKDARCNITLTAREQKESAKFLEDAISFQRAQLASAESHYGRDSVEYARALWHLGYVYKKQGDHTKAIVWYEGARSFFEGSAVWRGHPDHAEILNDLAAMYIRDKEWDEADTHLKAAHEIVMAHANVTGSKTAVYAAVLGHMVQVEQHRQNFDKALEYALDSFSTLVSVYGYEHVTVAWSALKLAELYEKVGMGVAADFRALAEGKLDPISKDLEKSLEWLALMSVALLQFAGARDSLDPWTAHLKVISDANNRMKTGITGIKKLLAGMATGSADKFQALGGSDGDLSAKLDRLIYLTEVGLKQQLSI